MAYAELIPVVEKNLTVVGLCERRWAHYHNLRHLTVLLLPILMGTGKVLVQRRPTGKSYAGHLDFFGGHVAFDKECWAFITGRTLDIAELIRFTAIREANEELRLAQQNGYPLLISDDNHEQYLRMVGSVGDFPWETQGNVEMSTLYLVAIPGGSVVQPMDDVQGTFFPLETEEWVLSDVVDAYRCSTGSENAKRHRFADGAERILKKFSDEPSLFESVSRQIEGLNDR